MASVHVPTPSADAVNWARPKSGFAQFERRRYHRFPIVAQAEYILAGHRAQATTLDIGRRGVLLKTDTILRVGQPIEVLIDWPALLDQRCPIRLVVCGKVIRRDWARTAVGITRYEFRIRAQNAARRSA